jgi:hypothetical protein
MAKKPDTKTEPKAPPRPPSVLDQLAILEKRHRRLRRAVVVLTLLVLIAVAVAAAALAAPYNAELGYYLGELFGRPEVIEAQKTILEAEQFALRGPDGKVRAALAVREGGAAGLDFYDQDGKARAGLDVAPDGQGSLWFAAADGVVAVSLNPRSLRLTDAEGGAFLTRSTLALADKNQKSRVTMSVKADGSPSLTLYDREGRTGALVDVPPEGSRLGLFHDGVARAGIGYGEGGAQLNLFGDDGKDHATLGVLPDGSAGLLFHDAEGAQRIALGVLPSSASGLSLFDRGGSHRLGLSVVPDGSPRVELYDTGGTRRAGLTLSPDGLPALQLEDKGQPRAVLGAATIDAKRGGTAKVSPPSSLLLFDKDGSVVFQAPIY